MATICPRLFSCWIKLTKLQSLPEIPWRQIDDRSFLKNDDQVDRRIYASPGIENQGHLAQDTRVTTWVVYVCVCCLIILGLKRNGRRFADILKSISSCENCSILIKISHQFLPMGLINNMASLVQMMAWCRTGEKPISEPVMAYLLTHICGTRPWWVNVFVS